METTKEFLEKYNKPLTQEQLNKIIYNLFCIFIFISPIIPEQLGGIFHSFKNLLFNSVTIVTAFSLIAINIKNLKINCYDVLLMIYLSLVILSSIFSPYGTTSCILGSNGRGEGVITISSYIATFIICSKGYPYIKKTYKYGIIGAIIVSIYGIIQANVSLDVALPFGSSEYLGVAEGTMKNQNFLSSYLCMFLPMMCYYFLDSKDNKSLIVVCLLFTCFVFCKTLGGYLVFIVAYITICIFCIIFSNKKKNTLLKVLILTITILLLFVSITTIKSDAYLKELAKTDNEVVKLVNENEKFGTNRLAIWKRVSMAIDNNKLLGVGPDNLKMEFRNEKYHLLGKDDMVSRKIVDKAHCEYLHIAVTTGIPSLIVYIIFISTICIKLVKLVINTHKNNLQNEDKLYITMTLIGIIGYLVQAIGNISVVQVAPVFWAILGLGAGITLHENTNKKEN